MTARTNLPEYNVWESMLTRCRNPRHHTYPAYGGKGITVCERWFSFDNFYEDMGPRPPGYWIERRDSKGNYEPGNCRWANDQQQSRNRSSNLIFTVNGITDCLAALCEIFTSPVPYKTVHARVKKGWPIESALKNPAKHLP